MLSSEQVYLTYTQAYHIPLPYAPQRQHTALNRHAWRLIENQNEHPTHTYNPTTRRPTQMAKDSTTTQTTTGKTLNGVGNIIKLLPTGTVFLFQFLSPVLTNYGSCSTTNKIVTGILLAACGFSCCFASFTDSYKDSNSKIHYGIVTTSGMWLFDSSSGADLSSYKLRFGDFVHAALALLVFAVMALMDANTVSCFYSSWESEQKAFLMAAPPVVGAICSGVSVYFPNTRHGIGYPPSEDSSESST
ncbi:hypothetical protein ACLOJK_025884 [Asimina triloba]